MTKSKTTRPAVPGTLESVVRENHVDLQWMPGRVPYTLATIKTIDGFNRFHKWTYPSGNPCHGGGMLIFPHSRTITIGEKTFEGYPPRRGTRRAEEAVLLQQKRSGKSIIQLVIEEMNRIGYEMRGVPGWVESKLSKTHWCILNFVPNVADQTVDRSNANGVTQIDPAESEESSLYERE